MSRVRPIRAEIVVAGAAGIWGLYWIPVRVLERQGLEPIWVALGQLFMPLLILLPFAVIRLARRQEAGFGEPVTGLLMGCAFVLYCESLLLTEVVRALILFYTMPVWGTLVEVFFMKRRFTAWRALALMLGLSGLVIILNIDQSFTLSMNLGDGMALVSGMFFTLAATRVRQSSDAPVFVQVFSFFFYGALIAPIFLLLPLTGPAGVPPPDLVIALLPWFLLMAVGFLIPIMWGLYWGSRFVDPGHLGILLQLEAVVGIGSAALFAGEPFGWREVTGSLLVISAGAVEVLTNRTGSRDA